MQKFNYLRAASKGEAAAVFQSLEESPTIIIKLLSSY